MKIGKIIGIGTLLLFLDLSTGALVQGDGGDSTLIHACVAKDGTIRMVGASTTCKNNETAVHWALSSGGIVVKDALGRLVGRFLVTGGAEAALMANGKVALLVGSAGFVLNPTWIVYQAPNCTGTGYMYSQIATELRLTETAWFDGQEFRYPSPSGPFVSFTGVSYLDGGFNCVNGDPGLSPDVKYAALQVVSLSSLNFVAPFHLE